MLQGVAHAFPRPFTEHSDPSDGQTFMRDAAYNGITGNARHGSASLGMTRYGSAKLGRTRQSSAGLAKARHSTQNGEQSLRKERGRQKGGMTKTEPDKTD